MRRKGISLPIEMVIIIAISVIVLLAIIAYFVGNIGTMNKRLGDTEAWNQACAMIKNRGCETAGLTQDDIENMKISFWYPYADEPSYMGSVADACQISAGTRDVTVCVTSCCRESGGTRTQDTSSDTSRGEELPITT